MNLDFSMVEGKDIIEYFRAILNVFLKIFRLEVKEDFTIGNFEVHVGSGTEA